MTRWILSLLETNSFKMCLFERQLYKWFRRRTRLKFRSNKVETLIPIQRPSLFNATRFPVVYKFPVCTGLLFLDSLYFTNTRRKSVSARNKHASQLETNILYGALANREGRRPTGLICIHKFSLEEFSSLYAEYCRRNSNHWLLFAIVYLPTVVQY